MSRQSFPDTQVGYPVTTQSQELPDSAAVSIYRRMATIRTAEERLIRGLSGGEFAFSYYPVRGHEAISATLGEVLRPDDQLSSTYRCFAVSRAVPLSASRVASDGASV